MGGIPVLGYDVAPGGGRLVVNSEEAERVRALFALYVEYRSVDRVLAALHARSWTNKVRSVKAVTTCAGKPFTKASLERLLTNVLYIGQVQYEGKTYAGEQAGIVEESVWRGVQRLLAEERVRLSSKEGPRGRSERGAEVQPKPLPPRVPRITRLMALALKFEQMIRQAVVNDHTELADLGRVSRSRVTQIMNLLNLAPDVQEQILFLKPKTAQQCGISEQSIRRMSSRLLWSEQRKQWNALISPSRDVA